MKAIDAVNRADVIDMLEMYPFTEYGEYETAREIVKRLPSAQPAPCEFCKHNNIADDKVCLMCSAERRTDEGD